MWINQFTAENAESAEKRSMRMHSALSAFSAVNLRPSAFIFVYLRFSVFVIE